MSILITLDLINSAMLWQIKELLRILTVQQPKGLRICMEMKPSLLHAYCKPFNLSLGCWYPKISMKFIVDIPEGIHYVSQ